MVATNVINFGKSQIRFESDESKLIDSNIQQVIIEGCLSIMLSSWYFLYLYSFCLHSYVYEYIFIIFNDNRFTFQTKVNSEILLRFLTLCRCSETSLRAKVCFTAERISFKMTAILTK